ncbi:hypothetical protein EIC00_24200 [Vibrio parahaemolyticus]|nr:hypothetical protein [Vibrio parahaemolyticus]EGR3234463.1 hypothetical protein [Vibrio parahaemolyticus]
MKRYLLVLFLLSGCQSPSSTYSRTPAKLSVPSDAYDVSICNFSSYSGSDCFDKVRQNIAREKSRRVKVLKGLENRYKSTFKSFEEIFYATYPAVNSLGEDVPYHLFILTEIMPPTKTEGAIFVFRHGSYDYGLLWSSDDSSLHRKAKLGTSLSQFVDCSVMSSSPSLVSLKYHALFSVPCD